jgi:hypothetical protein
MVVVEASALMMGFNLGKYPALQGLKSYDKVKINSGDFERRVTAPK